MITVLAGGVGAARFLQGLLSVHPPSAVTIISNVGDDDEFFGLHVSPDIDIVLYHLCGLANEEQGFGIRGDTSNVVNAMARFGYDRWFSLGDQDLATCITRTDLLRRGYTLSEAISQIARSLGAPARLIPVTDARLRTKIRTDEGVLDFQEYFVKRRAQDTVLEVIFEGADKATPAPGVLEAIMGSSGVIVCPSNPLLSIAPILAVPGIREALRTTSARVVAVSPIVGGRALKGPAAQILRQQGLEASCVTIAEIYRDFADAVLIDRVDAGLGQRIEAMGLEVTVADTIMSSMERKAALAQATLEAVGCPR